MLSLFISVHACQIFSFLYIKSEVLPGTYTIYVVVVFWRWIVFNAYLVILLSKTSGELTVYWSCTLCFIQFTEILTCNFPFQRAVSGLDKIINTVVDSQKRNLVKTTDAYCLILKNCHTNLSLLIATGLFFLVSPGLLIRKDKSFSRRDLQN